MKHQIPDDISVQDLQKYIWQMNIDRGFDLKDPSKKFVLLIEEIGELARAIRPIVGLKFDDTTKRSELKHELADVQILLMGLASMLDVDMLDAIREKEKKNESRDWNQ